MKRKHFFRTASLCCGAGVLMAAMLLTGCQGDGGTGSQTTSQQNSQSASQQSVVQTPDNSTLVSEESKSLTSTAAETPFKTGTWRGFSQADSKEQYYFFSDDGGQVFGVEAHAGLPFAYDYENGRAVFHMGSADDNSPCTVEVAGDGSAMTLKWDNGTTETLTYVSSKGVDDYIYMFNDDIEKLAIAYYKQQSGSKSENLTAGVQGNGDGTVTVQVYENQGDHNSTAAWYTVDRETGKGTDKNSGKAVDLISAASKIAS